MLLLVKKNNKATARSNNNSGWGRNKRSHTGHHTHNVKKSDGIIKTSSRGHGKEGKGSNNIPYKIPGRSGHSWSGWIFNTNGKNFKGTAWKLKDYDKEGNLKSIQLHDRHCHGCHHRRSSGLELAAALEGLENNRGVRTIGVLEPSVVLVADIYFFLILI